MIATPRPVAGFEVTARGRFWVFGDKHGLSVELIERLIETNFWLRRIPYAVCAGLFLWMAAQVMGGVSDRRAA